MILDQLVEPCRFLLKDFPEAQACRDYLDNRLKSDTQELFQFGYFPNMSKLRALTQLIDEDLLRKKGLLYSSTIEDALFPRKRLWNYFEDHPLIMPYRDPYGRTVGLIGRTLLPEQEMKEKKVVKYKNTEFKKGNYVFGLYENKQAILEQNCVYVVEGQFDVMKAVEIGLRNIVAIGGSNLSLYQFSVISRYTNNIFLLLDNDEAGVKGRKRIADKFGRLANIHDFYLPEGHKDIDEYIIKTGIDNYTDISFAIKG